MPELVEVETYRRAALPVVGRCIASVETVDPRYLRHGPDATTFRSSLAGRRVSAVRRHGKLLLLETDGPTLGLRFGMTGRLLVDDLASIDRLEYGGTRDDPGWDRLVLTFAERGTLRVRDPRRFGAAELDPDEDRLGPDAASISVKELRSVLQDARAPLKARLLDQSRIAGLGNLLVDETLWRTALDPARPAASLVDDDLRRLARGIRSTVADLQRRGGSHTGDLHAERGEGGRCPRDGAALVRRTVGGRTTWSCPRHQR